MQFYTNSVFDQLRQRQDPLADQAVSVLVQRTGLLSEINAWKAIPDPLPSDFPTELMSFFEFYLQKQKEYLESDLRPAQDFFEEKGDLYLAMLGFYSLPYCYAFADGAQVLVRSNRILDQIGERLGETASFVLEIFRPGAFSAQDEAYLVCAKVRLIHAFSRLFIRQYAKDWDLAFGQPVNQEDMLGTNLAFSHIVLRGLGKMRYSPSEKEYESVLVYWKWIGELMGIETQFWPTTTKEAFELDKLIRKRHLKSSEAGQRLVKGLLHFYQKTIPDPVLNSQAEGILSFFLGQEASEALNLKPGIKVPGEILGLVFNYSGRKNFGGRKGYKAFKKNLQNQQEAQFGKVLEIRLPQLNRT
nr:oxygenase MpaB family protein [Algoriphagus sp. AK58]